jgi:hypothetical protein
MICDCCRRDVDYVRASFWHGDARLCRECFTQWYSPDYDQFGSAAPMNVGNYVRLRHGLPPLATVIALLMLAGTTESYASRHCLDEVEASLVRPTRTIVQTGGGCRDQTYQPPRGEVPNSMSEPLAIAGEMRPERQPPPEPVLTLGRFLFFVSAVLAMTAPAFATWRLQSDPPPGRERSW